MQIVFATNNAHKLSEIKAIVGQNIEILSLKDIGCEVDILETGKTLEENALLKARDTKASTFEEGIISYQNDLLYSKVQKRFCEDLAGSIDK